MTLITEETTIQNHMVEHPFTGKEILQPPNMEVVVVDHFYKGMQEIQNGSTVLAAFFDIDGVLNNYLCPTDWVNDKFYPDRMDHMRNFFESGQTGFFRWVTTRSPTYRHRADGESWIDSINSINPTAELKLINLAKDPQQNFQDRPIGSFDLFTNCSKNPLEQIFQAVMNSRSKNKPSFLKTIDSLKIDIDRISGREPSDQNNRIVFFDDSGTMFEIVAALAEQFKALEFEYITIDLKKQTQLDLSRNVQEVLRYNQLKNYFRIGLASLAGLSLGFAGKNYIKNLLNRSAQSIEQLEKNHSPKFKTVLLYASTLAIAALIGRQIFSVKKELIYLATT